MEQVEETYGAFEMRANGSGVNTHSMYTGGWNTGNLQGSPVTMHCLRWSCCGGSYQSRHVDGLHRNPCHLSLMLHASICCTLRYRFDGSIDYSIIRSFGIAVDDVLIVLFWCTGPDTPHPIIVTASRPSVTASHRDRFDRLLKAGLPDKLTTVCYEHNRQTPNPLAASIDCPQSKCKKR